MKQHERVRCSPRRCPEGLECQFRVPGNSEKVSIKMSAASQGFLHPHLLPRNAQQVNLFVPLSSLHFSPSHHYHHHHPWYLHRLPLQLPAPPWDQH